MSEREQVRRISAGETPPAPEYDEQQLEAIRNAPFMQPDFVVPQQLGNHQHQQAAQQQQLLLQFQQAPEPPSQMLC